jgi:hypothetical protein
MTKAQLENRLKILLKNYIKDRKHIDTGKLYRSIKFKVNDDPQLGTDITLSSEYYISYLEDGEFVPDFFSLKSVIDSIARYEADKIIKSILN